MRRPALALPALRRPALALPALAIALLAANSCTSSHDPTKNVEVSLVSERSGIEPGKPFYVGIQMKLKDGWHTYWKNPGDSGLPVRVTWTLPAGFQAGPIEWPVPERIAENDAMSYGYRDEVLLPVRITPPARIDGSRIDIQGKVDWLECAEICVPGSAHVGIPLTVANVRTRASKWARDFAAARRRLPTIPGGWSFIATEGESTLTLHGRPPHGSSPRGAYLFVDQPLVVDYVAPQLFEAGGGGFGLTMRKAPNAEAAPARLTGVLVTEGTPADRSAFQIDVPCSIP